MTYYRFGLRAGISNAFSNGFRLGFKKTLGKITQPVNSYTRFPEYDYFAMAVNSYLNEVPEQKQVRVLDVGSPKLLGLYLAANTRSEITLTDISPLNVDEYKLIWQSLAAKAPGKVFFGLQDARALTYGAAEFDVVYSMSVIEHVEGEDGDANAVEEMIRVLTPGGLLVLSVPFGTKYVEQWRTGFAGAVRETGDSQAYFFQRIYDQAAFQTRVLDRMTGLRRVTFTTVWRTNTWLSRGFAVLGQNLRGAMGFMNPALSALVNRSACGIHSSFAAKYGPLHSAGDIYGDLIVTARKV